MPPYLNIGDCSMTFGLCNDLECDEIVETAEDNTESKYTLIYEDITNKIIGLEVDLN